MKLFLLKARKDLPKDADPWHKEYETNKGFVIRAASESHARELAQSVPGEESSTGTKVWLSDEYSTCVVLTSNGDEEIVITDFNAA